MKKIFILSVLVFFTIGAQATKGNKDLITIQITPDHYDWNYKIGEPAHFTISLFRDQQKLNNIKIEYAVGPEKMVPIQKRFCFTQERLRHNKISGYATARIPVM